MRALCSKSVFHVFSNIKPTRLEKKDKPTIVLFWILQNTFEIRILHYIWMVVQCMVFLHMERSFTGTTHPSINRTT